MDHRSHTNDIRHVYLFIAIDIGILFLELVRRLTRDIVYHLHDDNNHPHMIDLGLPSGTKWACCNEGANAPEEFGGYYSYGQISSAPSIDQIKELLNNCSYAWSSTKNGINGGEFTGPNGCTIFLPAAGYRFNGEMYSVGTFGEYWSSSPYINNYNHSDVCDLIFCPNYAVWSFNSQSANRSVRPVQ